MVTGLPRNDGSGLPSDRRGQLLLVGALVIALVIVVLAMVVNTVLFTENAGAERVSAEVEGVDEFAFQAGKTSRSILLRVNHGTHDRSVDQLQENVTRSIAGYDDALARSHVMSGTTYVNVSYNRTFHNGTRIVQSEDGNFTSPHATPGVDWSVISSGDETDVGWFLLNVNLRNTTAGHAWINVTGRSEELDFRMNRSDGGDGTNLSLAVYNSSTDLDSVNCTSSGGRVLLDIYAGTGSSEGCSFTGIDEYLGPRYDVSVADGDNVAGKYSIVTNSTWNASFASFDRCRATSADPVCRSPVVWNGSVDLTYQSPTVQYTQQRNVTVYGEGS
ncbi:DUF7261 family protein [Halorhabdus amylolytica]|uniref:DUF7261 family protein n=1 Tax=Halorhabdus amylolytica TaxID=2559573 RepID=UPI0010AA6D47|nr:hypothetical protein [Halorhabdus amylolytica]